MMTMTRPTVKRQPPQTGFQAKSGTNGRASGSTLPARLPVVVSDEDFAHETDTDAALLRRAASERML